ncbi:MAG: hypothetical protein IT318_11540 [Anaerolineales bacterium]|nr:hypothetical protein [Anaerolineales bacterium]
MDPRSVEGQTPGTSNSDERPELSEREREILILVATGASNKLIAQQLVISPNTVKVHLRNIFAKVGAASRTEAALYAIREGLVLVTSDAPVVAADEGPTAQAEAAEATPQTTSLAPGPLPAPAAGPRPAWQRWASPLVIAVALVSVLALVYVRVRPLAAPTPTLAPPTPLPRWITRADMPTARTGLAVATYENQIYAIAGETVNGIAGTVERYDPATNTWTTLRPKPQPVTDVGAAVIGGRIYVPGGRQPSGAVTDVLEVYDPRQDEWDTRAPLPVALSAYALADFEGHLFLLGGWDGQRYVASVYEYSPDQDEWTERAPMPTARGFSGAAAASGRIYVMGGQDAAGPLATNEEYAPEQDGGSTAWQARAPLPQPRCRMGIVSVANIVHIVGGEGGAQPMAPLEYFPQSNEWKTFETPAGPSWSGLGLTVVETVLHAIGGRQSITATTQHQSYQAIYTVSIPVIP